MCVHLLAGQIAKKVFAVSMEMKNDSYEKDLRVFILIAGVASFFKSASSDPIPPN